MSIMPEASLPGCMRCGRAFFFFFFAVAITVSQSSQTSSDRKSTLVALQRRARARDSGGTALFILSSAAAGAGLIASGPGTADNRPGRIEQPFKICAIFGLFRVDSY